VSFEKPKEQDAASIPEDDISGGRLFAGFFESGLDCGKRQHQR
jgi:hypothetical protein